MAEVVAKRMQQDREVRQLQDMLHKAQVLDCTGCSDIKKRLD